MKMKIALVWYEVIQQQFTMFGLTGLTKQQRFVLGIFVLLIVDIIWVASSELTKVRVPYIRPLDKSA